MTLIVAAWQPELRALGQRLRDEHGIRVAQAVVGVGPVEAAVGTTKILAARKPRAVILVGTAGVYPTGPDRPDMGQVVVARRITFASLATARALAYFPRPMPITTHSNPRLRARVARSIGALQVDVACPPDITRSAAAATSIARATGAAVENLEAFAVAQAAKAAAVPFVAVLGIANRVGPHAHVQWAAHGAAAVAAVCAGVRAFLRA